MEIIDLTHYFENNMTVFCDEEKVNIEHPYNIEHHGFRESKLNLFSHNGTHIDAPAHIISNGKYLDDYELDKFQGKALLINLENNFLNLHNKITLDMILPYENDIKNHEIIILKTGFYKYWNSINYLINYPILSDETAEYLASFDLKIIGLDTISPDEYNSTNLPIHHVFLEKEILILENLNLNIDLPHSFTLMAMPIKYKHSDGSFLRAISITDT